MRLQTWHDWTAETVTDERGNYMTYIDLEFEGETWRLQPTHMPKDAIAVLRETNTDVFYVYSTAVVHVGVDTFDLSFIEESQVENQDEWYAFSNEPYPYLPNQEIMVKGRWKVERELGKDWWEKTPIRNTKILLGNE